jgi:hypothetical protein
MLSKLTPIDLKPDYGSDAGIEPTAKNLALVLRRPHIWPKGFEWDYDCCSTCAMGLAHALWPDRVRGSYTTAVAEALGMDLYDAERIFLYAYSDHPISFFLHCFRVTPGVVAAELEKL